MPEKIQKIKEATGKVKTENVSTADSMSNLKKIGLIIGLIGFVLIIFLVLFNLLDNKKVKRSPAFQEGYPILQNPRSDSLPGVSDTWDLPGCDNC